MATEDTPLVSPHPEERALTWRVIAAILSGTIASFVAAADSTITSTLSSTIAGEFHSLAIISWLGAGYLIGQAATQPLTGKLSDIFGRKPSFIFATLVFTLGNLTCGFARTRTMLILGRVIAGIGGGGCSSIATYISSDRIPPRYRGIWHSMSIIAFTGGMGCGAVVGGAVNDALGWRWAFIMLAPISVTAGTCMAIFLPQEEMGNTSFRLRLRRIDYGGSVTLVSSLALFLIYVNSEERQSVVPLLLAAILFAIFLTIELRFAKEPIIPLAVLGQPTVLAACLCTAFMSMTIYTLMYYVPLYLQLRGHSTSQTGVLLLPEPIGGGLGSFTVGLVTSLSGKYGIWKVNQPMCIVIGSVGIATLSLHSPPVLAMIYQFVYGFGYGGLLTVLLLALLSAIPHEMQATSTSVLLTFRSIGPTIGLSVAGVLFRNRLNQPTADPNEQGQIATPNSTISYQQLHQFHAYDSSDQFQARHMYALHGTFQLAAALAIVGLTCAMFIKNHKLSSSLQKRENTGPQAGNDEAQEPEPV
ncbi:Major facilitator superfamily domain general substrate transporter [Penicillium frequentans]|nr:Major facilitator superfamily domain general substrate transporter [Penicillium glabrum]